MGKQIGLVASLGEMSLTTYGDGYRNGYRYGNGYGYGNGNGGSG